MRARIEPGGTVAGDVTVPGDKSIAHRWLILAATAVGSSRLGSVPSSRDVIATARCLAAIAPKARPSLDAWADAATAELDRSDLTLNVRAEGDEGPADLVIKGTGRDQLEPAGRALECANSGTTMRLLSGVLAAAPFRTELTGDHSLARRPMDRVAVPLRRMGARVRTVDGHPPVEIEGAALRGIRYRTPTPSAQVKGAILLAAVAAEGETTVEEGARTRDHTERALSALGGPVRAKEGLVTASRFQHEGFEGRVPGDISSAAFLIAAAGLTGGRLTVRGVGLNPTRTRFLDVMERMGIRTERRETGSELGEPVGELAVAEGGAVIGTLVPPDELPLVIDEVPVLAALAAHASGETRFRGGGELRTKETDRLKGLAEALRELGGKAALEGDDLVIRGGGMAGGGTDARGDHRMAMALSVAALRAGAPCTIEGIQWAAVSFPGFAEALRALGARVGS